MAYNALMLPVALTMYSLFLSFVASWFCMGHRGSMALGDSVAYEVVALFLRGSMALWLIAPLLRASWFCGVVALWRRGPVAS